MLSPQTVFLTSAVSREPVTCVLRVLVFTLLRDQTDICFLSAWLQTGSHVRVNNAAVGTGVSSGCQWWQCTHVMRADSFFGVWPQLNRVPSLHHVMLLHSSQINLASKMCNFWSLNSLARTAELLTERLVHGRLPAV